MTAPLLPFTAKKGERLSRLCNPLLPRINHLTFLGAFFFSGMHQLSAKPPEGEPSLLIVPDYQHPAISRFLPESKRTLVTPALVTKSGVITLLGTKDIETPEAWDHFIREAKESSALHLATLDPRMVKDEKGVIQMAVIISDSPITASLILLPGFLNHFSAIFGPELLLVTPTQNKICIFPKLANHLPQMRDAIRDEYLISPMPASTEIFELSRKGLRAVGSLNPDDE